MLEGRERKEDSRWKESKAALALVVVCPWEKVSHSQQIPGESPWNGIAVSS